jgi:16S rRNA (guanine527-N7)-methyltransferase
VSDLEQLPAIVDEAVGVLPEAMRLEGLEASLCGYLAHLLERNREVNLVSRRETVQHLARFTRECLFLARLLDEDRARLKLSGAPRLLDIGSGGGFPGIVLKIAMPDLEIQLVEGTRKKAVFLADVAAGLDLRQTSIIWGRAEDLADVQHLSYKREFVRRFDWVTGKALGTLGSSTTLATPFLRPEGAHWTFKGKACQTELESAGGVFRQRGFATLRVEPIPGEAESYVVGIRRLKS